MFTGRITIHKDHLSKNYCINGVSLKYIAHKTQTAIYEQVPNEWSKFHPWFMIMSPNQNSVIDAINNIMGRSNYMEWGCPCWHPPLYSFDEKNIREYFGEDILEEIEDCHEFNAQLTHFERLIEDRDLETSLMNLNITKSMKNPRVLYNDPYLTNDIKTEEERDLADTLLWNHWTN